MRISNLNQSMSFGGSDLIVVEEGGVTWSITGANLAAGLKEIGGYMTRDDYSRALASIGLCIGPNGGIYIKEG